MSEAKQAADDAKQGTGAEGASGTQNNPPPAKKGEDGEKIADVRAEAAAYRVEARKAKEEAAEHKKTAEELRKEKDAAVAAAKTEGTNVAEKFKKRAIDSEVKAKAVAAGLEDEDLLPLIRQKFGDDIKMDDDGNVLGIDEALAAAREKKPAWFKGGKSSDKDEGKGSGEGAKGTGSNKTPKPVTDIKGKSVKDMTPQEYRQFKAKTVGALRG